MTEFEFEQQVTALTQKMYRVSASLLRSPQDRQDAVQECVWKAWRKLPQLRDESLFNAWIMRILVNECKRLCHSHCSSPKNCGSPLHSTISTAFPCAKPRIYFTAPRAPSNSACIGREPHYAFCWKRRCEG